jgi:hypothetical protein
MMVKATSICARGRHFRLNIADAAINIGSRCDLDHCRPALKAEAKEVAPWRDGEIQEAAARRGR